MQLAQDRSQIILPFDRDARLSPSPRAENQPRVARVEEVEHLERDRSARFCFDVPRHWYPPACDAPRAERAASAIMRWFESLGCCEAELERSRKFDIAGYVGMPFPTLDYEQTVRIGKYLSLWLLWDDVHVEDLEYRWTLSAKDVLQGRRPEGMTRFEEGWWQLFREFSAARRPGWVERTCREMGIWSEAAISEARVKRACQRDGTLPSFARQLELRIATIGMYGTICLLEDIHDTELCDELYFHPTSRRLQYLAGKIVGIGNDVLSMGKDVAEGQINLVTTLMRERDVSMEQALATLIEMHDEAIVEFDQLAPEFAAWAVELQPRIDVWLQDLRYASLGFTLWESQAPRYAAYKLLSGNRVIEPRLV